MPGFVPDALRVLAAAAGRDPRARDQDRHQRRRAEPGGLRPRVRRGRRGGGRAAEDRRDRGRRPARASWTQLRADGAADMFTGEPLPPNPMTINAYLGARPIAAALAAGADVVITGRSVDSSVVLGPLLHEFGWTDEDYDLLSAGHAGRPHRRVRPAVHRRQLHRLGHRPRLGQHGLPGHRVPLGRHRDRLQAGRHRRARHAGDDRRADRLRDRRPGRLRDARRRLRLARRHARAGRPDQVRASGAKGSRPPATYKVTATHADGYRVMTNAMFSGIDAGGKARRAGEALVTRAERMIAKAGFGPITERSIEVVGAGDTARPRAPQRRRDGGGRQDRRCATPSGRRSRSSRSSTRRWRSSPRG